VVVVGQPPARREPSREPSPQGPYHTSGGSDGGFKKNTVHVKDGLVIIALAPILRAKVETLRRVEGDPIGEVLEGLGIEELERKLGFNYELYSFRVSGDCFEVESLRFRVWCRDLSQYLEPGVIGPTRFEVEDLLKRLSPVDSTRLKQWVDRLLELDRELSEVDSRLVALLSLDSGLVGGVVEAVPQEFNARVSWLKDKILELVNPQEFEDLDTKHKIKIVFDIISRYFDFIRLLALDVNEDPEVYALDGDVLLPVDSILAPVLGSLVKAGLIRKSVMGDLELAAFSTSNVTSWREVNPWDKIRLRNGVLDLESLRLLDKTSYYFTYRLDVSLTEGELREVRDGGYRVEDNIVFRSWRAHFEDVDWDYLVDSLGTWLAPFRFKHIAFLIGPRNSGKSTLLLNLTEPINPIIARTSLRNIVESRFGLQPLIGKQVLVHSERGDVVLKNLDIINNLLGESDYIPVDRKHLPMVNIRSLKAAMFSMNDPPILYEQGGETLAAFLERLSIIFMRAPEDFKPVKNFRVDPKEAFKFLLWCRARLEDRGWEIRMRGFEEKLDYLTKMANTALRFLETETTPDPDGRIKGTELYEAYVKWCMERGLAPMGLNNFYATVATKYTNYKRDKVVWFRGLRLVDKPKGLRG
jgi:hypothetical protein